MTPSFLKRRDFLARSAAVLGSLALPPALANTPSASATTPPLKPGAWEALRRITQGHLLRPDDTTYAASIIPNNLSFQDIRPAGVAFARSPEMVADILRWCQDNAIPFAIRGGGHSYAGYSSSSGLVISMAEMSAIDYHPDTQQVTIGAGAINGPIYGALQKAGRTMTHGRCPTVGVAGFLLGGGIGFNMRRFGMACDHMVKAQIVTADGRVRTVSAQQEPDLFWALRGGTGGNFGVSTAFTLNTHPADPKLTVCRLVWRQNTRAVAERLFAVLDAAPTGLGTRVALGGVTPELGAKGRQVPVTLLAQYTGSAQELLALLAPVLAIAPAEHQDIRETSYWEGQGFLMEPGAPDWFRERSAFRAQAPDAAFLDAAFEQLTRWTGTGGASSLFFFQTGGQINAVAPDATAFVHRNSRWLSVVGITWGEGDLAQPDRIHNAMAWQDGLYAVMNQHGGTGAFQNFPDAWLDDWRIRYYGANLPKLTQIKAAVDPRNVFRFQQSL